jgi:hypothetical protein
MPRSQVGEDLGQRVLDDSFDTERRDAFLLQKRKVHMKQEQVQSVFQALHKSDVAGAAATEHGAAIGLTRNTAAPIAVERAGLVTKHHQYETTTQVMVLRRTALQAVLLLVFAYVMLVRDFLKIRHGNQHSQKWIGTGFPHSLTIPRTVAGLKFVLEAQVTYFTDNPTHGSVDLNISADRALSFLDDLRNAEAAVNSQKAVVGAAKEARDAAFTTMRNRLRALFKELSALLDPMSNLFLTFGFNKPGALAIPAIPKNVIAVLLGNNSISVEWDAAARAERYRIWVKVHGVDTDFVLRDTWEELAYLHNDVPANTKVEIAVSAINNGGESARSEVVSVTTAA